MIPHRLFCLLLICSLYAVSCKAQSTPSLDEKIGQMLLVGFRGYEVHAQSPIVKDIQQYHLGGVILFDYDVPNKKAERNIASPFQVKKLTAQLRSYNRSELPLFIAIDQEGGKVNRLKQRYGFPASVSAAYLGGINKEDSTRFHARKTSRILRDLGINLNFAPVLDVNTYPENPIIGALERSFSAQPSSVFSHGLWWMQEAREERVLSAFKHFPGHGSSDKDSHLGMVDVTKRWHEKELIPYKEMMPYEPDMIMTAHIYNTQMDSTRPATLSHRIITGTLRNTLGFHGVVVSDDMQMEAIRAHFGLETALVDGIMAGVDLFIFANNSVFEEDIVQRAVAIIKEHVNKGTIPEARITESYERINALKQRLK